jgi:hypothetical protein
MLDNLKIVVGTSPGRESWLSDCLSSISYPTVVVSNFGFEIGKFRWIIENTSIQRFVFLQDTVKILDNTFFEVLDKAVGSISLMDVPGPFGSYLGVFERKIINEVGLPVVASKSDSIFFENHWATKYFEACGTLYAVDGLENQLIENQFKNGRNNLVYRNRYFEKWKGDWGQISHDESSEDIVSLHRTVSSERDGLLELSALRSALEASQQVAIENRNKYLSLESRNSSLEIHNLDLINQLVDIKNSLSWKVTSPVRKLFGYRN